MTPAPMPEGRQFQPEAQRKGTCGGSTRVTPLPLYTYLEPTALRRVKISMRNMTDWTGCDLVEIDPDKVAGQPVIRGTRIPAEVILIDEDYGRTPEQTHDSFPTLSIQTIRALRAFAHSQDLQSQP